MRRTELARLGGAAPYLSALLCAAHYLELPALVAAAAQALAIHFAGRSQASKAVEFTSHEVLKCLLRGVVVCAEVTSFSSLPDELISVVLPSLSVAQLFRAERLLHSEHRLSLAPTTPSSSSSSAAASASSSPLSLLQRALEHAWLTAYLRLLRAQHTAAAAAASSPAPSAHHLLSDALLPLPHTHHSHFPSLCPAPALASHLFQPSAQLLAAHHLSTARPPTTCVGGEELPSLWALALHTLTAHSARARAIQYLLQRAVTSFQGTPTSTAVTAASAVAVEQAPPPPPSARAPPSASAAASASAAVSVAYSPSLAARVAADHARPLLITASASVSATPKPQPSGAVAGGAAPPPPPALPTPPPASTAHHSRLRARLCHVIRSMAPHICRFTALKPSTALSPTTPTATATSAGAASAAVFADTALCELLVCALAPRLRRWVASDGVCSAPRAARNVTRALRFVADPALAAQSSGSGSGGSGQAKSGGGGIYALDLHRTDLGAEGLSALLACVAPKQLPTAHHSKPSADGM